MDRPRSLSFAITTRGPAARVRALLEYVRPHVDEIVLAADRDGDPDVLDACADLADRRLRFVLRDSPARLIGWIQHECSADWILRLDDDEVPSPAMLAALPELMSDRRIAEVGFRRRWLWPSADRWIDVRPWRLDYQMRLLRNVPGLWSFEGRVHTIGSVNGERRLVEEPMYHCDLVLSSLDARLRKQRRYQAEEPGAHWDGYSTNAAYVPEHFASVSTAEVPPGDRPPLEAVIGAERGERLPPPRPRAHVAPVIDATWEEVNRHNRSGRPSAAALQGSLEWVTPPRELPAGASVHHDLRVRNLGDALWRPDGAPPAFHVEVRCRYAATGELAGEGLVAFTETVWPGQETVLLVPIATPARPGNYELAVDLLHERHRFGDGPRTPLVVRGTEPEPELNGELGAAVAAGRELREAQVASRRARELADEAAALRATRRYRLVDGLARLRRPGAAGNGNGS